jgi:hypothetical protein
MRDPVGRDLKQRNEVVADTYAHPRAAAILVRQIRCADRFVRGVVPPCAAGYPNIGKVGYRLISSCALPLLHDILTGNAALRSEP